MFVQKKLDYHIFILLFLWNPNKLLWNEWIWIFRIACVSSPTAYKRIRELKPEGVTVYCLEYDERFKVFGEDFVFYDYKEPLRLPADFKNSFDIVIADPPFLSEECLCKTAMTVKYLMKEKIIICTGKNTRISVKHYFIEWFSWKRLLHKICLMKGETARGWKTVV